MILLERLSQPACAFRLAPAAGLLQHVVQAAAADQLHDQQIAAVVGLDVVHRHRGGGGASYRARGAGVRAALYQSGLRPRRVDAALGMLRGNREPC